MNRQRIIWMALPILLGAWWFLWKMSSARVSTSVGTWSEPTSVFQKSPSSIRERGAFDPTASSLVSSRNPFQMPASVTDFLLQKDQEKRRLKEREEEARRQRQETALPVPGVALPKLTLQGLLWEAGEPMAIINRRIVRRGDLLEGAQVAEISKEGVTIRYEGQEWTLRTDRREDSR